MSNNQINPKEVMEKIMSRIQAKRIEPIKNVLIYHNFNKKTPTSIGGR